jgi:hypothetical protein
MRARLGDDIDDFCVKCKRIMNPAVVSRVGEEPAKVRCRTCHSDHDYRHELPPPPKVDPRKAALFNQVLEKVTGDVPAVPMDSVAIEGLPPTGLPPDAVPLDSLTPENGLGAITTPAAAPLKSKGRAKKA